MFNQQLQNNILNQFKQMVSSGLSPQQLTQQFINNNPQAQVVFNQMQQSGLNPTQYILQIAKQNNLPINEAQINGLMQSFMGFIPH